MDDYKSNRPADTNNASIIKEEKRLCLLELLILEDSKFSFCYTLRGRYYCLEGARCQQDPTFLADFSDNAIDFIAKIESVQSGHLALIIPQLKLILSKYYL